MIALRPIGAQDRDAFQAFVQGLSAQARVHRFLQPLRELSPAALDAMTQADQSRHVALVATDEGRIVGEARWVALADSGHAEFAVAVADGWRRQGLGARLLGALMLGARRAGLRTLEGEVLRTNDAMLGFVRRLGFRLKSCPEDARLLIAERELDWARLAA